MIGARGSERTLSRGRLRFEAGQELVIELSSAVRECVTPPFPRHGYGGHELVVSRDERFLALFLFSGQSEQGWELFSLTPTLRHLGGLPYVLGEGDAPQFSPDGTWLAMFVAIEPTVRGTGEYFETVSDPDAPADATADVEWAQLLVQHIPDGAIERHTVCAKMPLRIDPDSASEWTTYGALRFTAADELELMTPWNERIICTLPIASVPITPVPA